MNLRMRTKLLLALFLSALVPVLLICIVLGVKVKNSSFDLFFSASGKELGHIEKAISIFINETKATTTMLATNPLVAAADSSVNSFINEKEKKSSYDMVAGPVEENILAIFRSLVKANKSFMDVYIGTEFGGMSSGSEYPLPAGYDPRVRPWYKEAKANAGRPVISKAYQSVTGDSAVVTAAQTVENNGKVIGVIGIDVALNDLTDFIKSIKMGKNGYVMLVQDDGVVLADPRNPDHNFKKLSEIGDKAFQELDGMSSGDKMVVIDNTDYAAKVLTSPDLGWKLIGLTEKSEIMQQVYSMVTTIIAIGTVLIILALVCGYLLARSLTRPLLSTTKMIQDIAQGEGDLTKRLNITGKDEIGELAHWFNLFLGNLQNIIKELAGHTGVVDASSGRLSEIASLLTANAGESSVKAERVSSATHEMTTRMERVASTMEETTSNTSMVAAAVEEMAATINEIAHNSEKARGISENAVSQAASASDKVTNLGNAAAAITAVTETITEISEQTNLLALNATIEAARAGEAGKGFAVVANEIKELARQTAAATAEIKAKIEGVQGTTRETVSEIETIGKVIHDINDIIATIATAIEEQSAATKEISSNVTQASQGIEDVSGDIASGSEVIGEIAEEIGAVNASSSEISRNSQEVESSARELRQLSEQLNNIIQRFRI